MKTKKFLIALLLVSFCGPQTQAEICEEYWYIAAYEIEQLSLSAIDLQNLALIVVTLDDNWLIGSHNYCILHLTNPFLRILIA